METKTVTRRYDLDWMRIIGILTVFMFHSVRAFNFEPWSIKNAITYRGAQFVTDLLGVWQMPLIFVISGASLYFALGKGGPLLSRIGGFIKDKFLRLLVPLVVGVFTYTTYVVYLDRLTNGKFNGTFLQFLPHYFDGIYLSSTSDGNFAFHGLHLWYLLVLFIFCIVLLPLFMFLKSRRGGRLLDGLTRFMALPGVFYLVLCLPVVLSENFLDENSILGANLLGWSLVVYACFFISGFVIISSQRLQDSIMRLRWLSLAFAVGLAILYFLTDQAREVMAWAFVLTILGFGMKYLNVTTPFLKYASDAVLPFYIEHQTFIIIIGFSVVTWQIPDLLKWAIITLSSFGACVGVYEYLVRRHNVLRFLFGMKPLSRAARPVELPAKTAPSMK